VASVACGLGLTQIMTPLATAAWARIPFVVFSGESQCTRPDIIGISTRKSTGVMHATLSDRLKHLEENAMIKRRRYQSGPDRASSPAIMSS
jgi:hypothetical protein